MAKPWLDARRKEARTLVVGRSGAREQQIVRAATMPRTQSDWAVCVRARVRGYLAGVTGKASPKGARVQVHPHVGCSTHRNTAHQVARAYGSGPVLRQGAVQRPS
jgi:hypothetical protein